MVYWETTSEQGVCMCVCVVGGGGGVSGRHTPLLIEKLSCKLLSSHMHETRCTNQLIPLLTGQHTISRNNTNFRDAEPAVCPTH